MKIFRSWKTLLVIALILAFTFLFSILYQDARSLPSENWSQSIDLFDYSTGGDYESFYNDNFDVLHNGNHFEIVYLEEGEIIWKQYDLEAVEIGTTSFPYQGDRVESLYLAKDTSGLHLILYRSQMLEHYLLEDDRMVLVESFANITSFSEVSNLGFVYIQDQDLYRYDYAVSHPVDTLDTRVEIMNALISDNDTIHLAFIGYENAEYRLYASTYSAGAKTSSDSESLTFLNAIKILNLEIAQTEDSIKILSLFKYTKFNTNYAFLYDYQNGMITNEPLEIETDIYSPDPYLIDYSDPFTIILSGKSDVGRVDVSKKDEIFPNILRLTLEGERITSTPLSKTIETSGNPRYLSVDAYDYLFFTDSTTQRKTLKLASNHPVIIENSIRLESETLVNIALNTLTTFLPLFYVGLVPGIFMILPVIFIILPVAMFKMNWVEDNPKKLLILSIAIYLTTKFYYLINQGTLEGFPLLMGTIGGRLLVHAFMTLFSLLALKLYYEKDHHFIKSFVFFYIFDILLFTLIFTPYFVI